MVRYPPAKIRHAGRARYLVSTSKSNNPFPFSPPVARILPKVHEVFISSYPRYLGAELSV